MSQREPVAWHDHDPARPEDSREFLKRTRSELRSLVRVRVYTDRVEVYDVNRDYFLLRGVGYPDSDIVPILEAIGAAFNRDTVHADVPEPFKEFRTSRRHPWAEDRVM